MPYGWLLAAGQWPLHPTIAKPTGTVQTQDDRSSGSRPLQQSREPPSHPPRASPVLQAALEAQDRPACVSPVLHGRLNLTCRLGLVSCAPPQSCCCRRASSLCMHSSTLGASCNDPCAWLPLPEFAQQARPCLRHERCLGWLLAAGWQGLGRAR
jgi:hypothetical protein